MLWENLTDQSLSLVECNTKLKFTNNLTLIANFTFNLMGLWTNDLFTEEDRDHDKVSPTPESRDDDEEEEETKSSKGRQKEAGVTDETEEGEKKIQKDAGYTEVRFISLFYWTILSWIYLSNEQ